MRASILRLLLTYITTPVSIAACSVCYGNVKGPAKEAVNMSILTLLIIVVILLIGFAGFFFYLIKKSKAS